MTLMKEKREEEKKKKKKKKNNFGLAVDGFFIIEKYQPKNLCCPPFLSAIGSARNQKNLLKANGPFFLCVKILIASATRFAAFGAEKEEREKETRASSYLLRRERERESFCRAIHRLSKKRFEQNDYLILSRLTVCACVGFAVEIL